jgi:hypothetical protein
MKEGGWWPPWFYENFYSISMNTIFLSSHEIFPYSSTRSEEFGAWRVKLGFLIFLVWNLAPSYMTFFFFSALIHATHLCRLLDFGLHAVCCFRFSAASSIFSGSDLFFFGCAAHQVRWRFFLHLAHSVSCSCALVFLRSQPGTCPAVRLCSLREQPSTGSVLPSARVFCLRILLPAPWFSLSRAEVFFPCPCCFPLHVQGLGFARGCFTHESALRLCCASAVQVLASGLVLCFILSSK